MKTFAFAVAAALLFFAFEGCNATVRTGNAIHGGQSYQGKPSGKGQTPLPTPAPGTDTSGPHQINIVVRDRDPRVIDPDSVEIFVPEGGKRIEVIVKTK